MTKLTVAIRNFANAPKNRYIRKSIHQKITENCKTSQHKRISRETSEQGRISPSPLLQNSAGIALSVVIRLQVRQLEASLFNTWQGKKFLFYKESRADMRSTQSPVWTGDKATGMRSWPITSNWVPSSIMWSHTDTAPIRLHGVHRNKFVFFTIQNNVRCSRKRYVRREYRPQKGDTGSSWQRTEVDGLNRK